MFSNIREQSFTSHEHRQLTASRADWCAAGVKPGSGHVSWLPGSCFKS